MSNIKETTFATVDHGAAPLPEPRPNWVAPMLDKTPLVGWSVTVTRGNDGDGRAFMASLPFRQVYVWGDTEAEAVGGLVRAYAGMARSGSFDPHYPNAKGSPIIQHALDVLTEHLRYVVDNRGSCAADESAEERGASQLGEAMRRSEEIAAVATAIAALGRVKGL